MRRSLTAGGHTTKLERHTVQERQAVLVLPLRCCTAVRHAPRQQAALYALACCISFQAHKAYRKYPRGTQVTCAYPHSLKPTVPTACVTMRDAWRPTTTSELRATSCNCCLSDEPPPTPSTCCSRVEGRHPWGMAQPHGAVRGCRRVSNACVGGLSNFAVHAGVWRDRIGRPQAHASAQSFKVCCTTASG